MNDEKQPINTETSLLADTRALLRASGHYAPYRHLVMAYPPVAGVLNRVADCLGDELHARSKPMPLVAAIWAGQSRLLRKAQATLGSNAPDYMIAGLVAALSPLDVALDMVVSTRESTDAWKPERDLSWAAWRVDHPGKLCVTNGRPLSDQIRENHRVSLERWALGQTFTKDIAITAQWPETTISA